MAVFQGFSSAFPLNFETAFLGDATSVVRQATASLIAVDLGSGVTESFTGSFTYSTDGTTLTGGTVTGFNQSFLGTPIAQATGISIAATTVSSLILSGQSLSLIQQIMAGNDVVNGTGGIDLLHGNAGDDTIDGGAGSDALFGDAGNDRITGGVGNDVINGGTGTDVAVYSGKASDYTITPGAAALTVAAKAGTDGSDTLQNIEILQFSDKAMFVLSGQDAQVARLYSAAFGRAPDVGGLVFQIENGLHAGLTLNQLAQNFIGSAEFIAKYGQTTTNDQYATALYSNVLGRTPDPAGLAFQVLNLDAGLSRIQMLLNFADAPENKTKVLADWMLLG